MHHPTTWNFLHFIVSTVHLKIKHIYDYSLKCTNLERSAKYWVALHIYWYIFPTGAHACVCTCGYTHDRLPCRILPASHYIHFNFLVLQATSAVSTSHCPVIHWIVKLRKDLPDHGVQVLTQHCQVLLSPTSTLFHPAPMPDHLPGKKSFPNIQPKPPLAPLEAVSSCPLFPGRRDWSLSGLSHSAGFSPSSGYTPPYHGKPVFPGEFCCEVSNPLTNSGRTTLTAFPSSTKHVTLS